MTLPTSTYRIQFRDGMTFDRVVEIIPYLKRLGISHLYASPVFTATSGSTHGYDVTDANEIDPDIGGRSGFDRMSAALKSAGLGLLIDIVPNHMAASLENRWWRSVVEWGQESPFANHFDIDWSRRLTLPMLGKPLDDAIQDGELKLSADMQAGNLAIAYYDQKIPLNPKTYHLIPSFAGSNEVWTLAQQASAQQDDDFHSSMVHVLKKHEMDIDPAVGRFSSDQALMRKIIDAQPWELLYWRDAPQRLSYRRFFEVTGLVGLRVEDSAVFDAAHKLVLELVRSGAVDGLRLDHIDGLADPAGYLDRLRQAVGQQTYIVVEKILAKGEVLPRTWPISGTTGYEFITSMPDVLVDQDGMKVISATYRGIAPSDPDFIDGVRSVKAMLAIKNFAVETRNLLTLLTKACEATNAPHEGEALEAALVALLVACPVYRTYGTANGLGEDDETLWESIVRKASSSEDGPDKGALHFVDRLFRNDIGDETKEISETFRRRFQQLTGPLTAKAVEDTMFYRYNRLLSLNEVGGEPAEDEFTVARLHEAMRQRAATQPLGLSASSTHDTKRGEDARARLHALSECAAGWTDAVTRWRKMNAGDISRLKDGVAPEPQVEWMLYEALVGVWPADLEMDDTIPDDLKPRFTAYVEKALREAKQRTNWGEESEAYETAVRTFAEGLLTNAEFQTDFRATLRPIIRAGLFNSLSQTIVKLAAPGIPDIYQGSEQLDFSLVDPDNRRMPDYARLSRDLGEAMPEKDETALRAGILKQHVVARSLVLRQTEQALFAEGTYEALKVIGDRSDHAISFSRRLGDRLVIAVAPRLLYNLAENQWPCGKYWLDTAILLPGNGRPWTLHNVVDGTTFQATNRLELGKLLEKQPVALLVSQP